MHKKILCLMLALVICFSPKIIKYADSKKYLSVYGNLDEVKIEHIELVEKGVVKDIKYPVIGREDVDRCIKQKVDFYVNKVENSDYVSDDKKVKIDFETYESGEIVSFKFCVTSNIGITHDSIEYFTVCFDKTSIIDINKLKEQKSNVLNDFSEICYSYLMKDSTIKEYSNEEWVKKGTAPKEENYNNFYFTQDGIMIIFNEYSVAPSVAGMYEILIDDDIF